MTKDSYREFFANVKPILKLNYFCKLSGVSQVSLSRFMKGSEWNYEISEDRLHLLYSCIVDHLQKIA